MTSSQVADDIQPKYIKNVKHIFKIFLNFSIEDPMEHASGTWMNVTMKLETTIRIQTLTGT
jgi:hypothetical protein